ncbi:hypothetical protein BHM03_00010522 [Ensete ventricosum]|uniref:Protein FAR1-RELATED SEQUENCE n=1 Tax=Ensete ventricosum TaxID=4639 RepID=A0A445MD31_ENSVE|nr:hypothetical protein BHM03_00010522 [Ensete ventricosum]
MQGAQHITAEATAVDAPYVGQSFRTDDEAQEYYTNFARKNGFAIRRERSKGNPAHPLGVYKRELVCHRAGVSLPRKTVELKRQRNKKSSRCRCEAQMIIKKNVLKGTTCWIVVHFSNEHNHQLLDSEEVRHLPAYRNIPPAVRERILFLSKAGCTVNLMMRALEMERGAKPGHLTFTERDLRNFLQANKGIDRETEGSELLKACKAMRDKSSDFRYDYTLDANQKLEHIAWSYPDGVHAYKVFGDVVIFDTTYRLYAYDRPFGVWFGVDNYGNLIFLGCVLLQDERPASFRWALQVLMDGKFPQTIMTDLDMGLREAMMSELPNTKHAFGICATQIFPGRSISQLPYGQVEVSRPPYRIAVNPRVFIVVIYFTLRFPSREGYGLAYRQPRISRAFVWTAQMLRDAPPCGPLGTAAIFIGFIVLPLSSPLSPRPLFCFSFRFLVGLHIRSRNERARDPRRLRSLEVLLEFVSASRNGASDRAYLARSVNLDLGNLNAVLLRRASRTLCSVSFPRLLSSPKISIPAFTAGGVYVSAGHS